MLSVQSPLQLAMSNDNLHDEANATWNAWRASANLPTPPSSDPPRRLGTTKQHWTVGHGVQQRTGPDSSVDGGYQHLTLPPIAHIDRHWPTSSPLTPPDDEMHASPLSRSVWRDAKPGPSRMHSPLTSNTPPFLASPSPSPVDEDERYDEEYDAMDEQPEAGDQDWSWAWQEEQQQERGIEGQHGEGSYYECSRRQSVPSEPSNHITSNTSAADWVTNPSQCSAHFIAEKTCEMICYLWFSSSLGPRAAAASRARRERERCQRRRGKDASANSPSFAQRPLSNASTAALQFCASPEFVAFMTKLLATTQVSQSVIVLSLHYIFRLKERNDFTLGKPGSEFRVAVCALMLANKFVDDNTYTNKTWSEVSAISLEELNKMEREFLLGIGFRLYVDLQTYEAWLNLLKGLVLTKEREYSRWRERRRARVVVPRIKIPDSDKAQHREAYREHHPQQRARSTSPQRLRNYEYAPAYPFTFTVPSSSAAQLQATSQSYSQSHSAYASPSRPISSKRTAADAFSPTSATFAGTSRGGKRPIGLALDIPAALASAASSNPSHERTWERAGSVSAQPAYSYADSLHRLEKMSLATPVDQQPDHVSNELEQTTGGRDTEEQILAASYRGVDAARRAPPPHLYFYALASSPLTSPYYAPASECAASSLSVSYTPASDANASLAEERPTTSEGTSVLPPGAERKTRLRYVDSHVGKEYGYDYNTYTYGHTSNYNQAYSYTSYPAPAPAPAVVHRSSTALSPNAYTQAQCQTQYPRPIAQDAQSQHMHGYQSVQQPQHLPPLALALSMQSVPTRDPATETQSACTSPLPGVATLEQYAPRPVPFSYGQSPMQSQYEEASPARSTHAAPQTYSSNVPSNYQSVSHAHPCIAAPAPAVQSAWSAPPSETVDGVYAPVPRHVRSHTHRHLMSTLQQQSHLPPPVSYKSYPSVASKSLPGQDEAGQDVTGPTSSTECASHLPERAAFANAGPPGVAHFYSYPRFGSSSSTDGYSSAYNSNALPYGVQSTGMLQQSQSVTASPEGPYAYAHDSAMRSRRP